MKINSYIKLIFFGCFLTACGQEGPLYLPTDTPPIAVSPEIKKQLKEKKQKEEKKPITIEKGLDTPPDLIKEN
jgi:predicted small lipoprotein YifL